MDTSTKSELKRIIKRTDSFMERAAVMLSTGKKGESFPPNTEFTELELKSYDNAVTTLVVRLLRTPQISNSTWISPTRYAYQYVENRTRWTWLERFHQGLSTTKEFLDSYLVEDGSPREYNVNIENSTGVVVSIDNADSPIELVNNLSSNELELLADELARLREALRENSDQIPEHDVSIGYIANAEIAAVKKDKKGIIENLKKAGQWAFDNATKIGVSVTSKIVAEMLK